MKLGISTDQQMKKLVKQIVADLFDKNEHEQIYLYKQKARRRAGDHTDLFYCCVCKHKKLMK